MVFQFRRLLPLCCLLALLSACCTVPREAEHRFAADGDAVYHFVAVWLQEPGDPAQRAAIVEATRSFTEIPGVLFADAGVAMPDERPVVVSDYDLGILIVFEDEAALRAYNDHPLHQAAVHDVLRPAAAKIRVYDFNVEAGP